MRSDADIATAAANALRWNVATAGSSIRPIVKDGVVTLSGDVQWGFQKTSAMNAVRNLIGVKGVVYDIRVTTAIGQHRASLTSRIKSTCSIDREGRRDDERDHGLGNAPANLPRARSVAAKCIAHRAGRDADAQARAAR